jgi:hypothetical protein
MRRQPRFPLLLLLLVAGCTPERYGVWTSATVPRPLDVSCVDAAVRGVEGAGVVRHDVHEDTAFGLAPRWGRKEIRSDVWAYAGGLQLQIIRETPGETTYSNSLDAPDPVPEHRLAVHEALLWRVNDAVERQCGPPLRTLLVVERN